MSTNKHFTGCKNCKFCKAIEGVTEDHYCVPRRAVITDITDIRRDCPLLLDTIDDPLKVGDCLLLKGEEVVIIKEIGEVDQLHGRSYIVNDIKFKYCQSAGHTSITVSNVYYNIKTMNILRKLTRLELQLIGQY